MDKAPDKKKNTFIFNKSHAKRKGSGKKLIQEAGDDYVSNGFKLMNIRTGKTKSGEKIIVNIVSQAADIPILISEWMKQSL